MIQPSRTVIVIKPDGLKNQAAREMVYLAIERSGLEVIDRYCTRLSEQDVLDIWPRFAQRKYIITATLLHVYMTEDTAEVFVLSGANAISKCRDIRSLVRKRFGDSAVANCLHTAADEAEAHWNVEKLHGCGKLADDFVRPNVMDDLHGVWGCLGELPPYELEDAVRRCWRTKIQCGWESIWPRIPPQGEYAAYLHPGDPNTIDYGISALYQLARGRSVESCVGTYLQAEILGRALIATGTESAMTSLAAMFNELELRVETRHLIQR